MKVAELQKTAHFQQVAREHAGRMPSKPNAGAFDEILRNKISKASQPVKFSSHAAERLASRNIVLTEKDMTKINQAVDKVDEKGGKESLLLMGDLAFVVSVENKTVITALDTGNGVRDRVFTNIDSALII